MLSKNINEQGIYQRIISPFALSLFFCFVKTKFSKITRSVPLFLLPPCLEQNVHMSMGAREAILRAVLVPIINNPLALLIQL